MEIEYICSKCRARFSGEGAQTRTGARRGAAEMIKDLKCICVSVDGEQDEHPDVPKERLEHRVALWCWPDGFCEMLYRTALKSDPGGDEFSGKVYPEPNSSEDDEMRFCTRFRIAAKRDAHVAIMKAVRRLHKAMRQWLLEEAAMAVEANRGRRALYMLFKADMLQLLMKEMDAQLKAREEKNKK